MIIVMMIMIVGGSLGEAPTLQVNMDFLKLSPTPTRLHISGMPLQTALHESNCEGAFSL